jgi:hypothetical protein
MKPARKHRSTSPTRVLLCLALSFALLTTIAHSQSEKPQPKEDVNAADIAKAIVRVKSGDFAGYDVEMIAEGRAIEVIPLLKDRFVRSQDESLKSKIANVLIRLGEQDNLYWGFLAERANLAIDSDAPSYLCFDEQGKVSPEQPSPAFVDWAMAHHIPLETASEDALFTYPGAVLELGSTGDTRGTPILRRALLSPNFLIRGDAALGLAAIHDKNSIPLIVEACQTAPSEAAEEIAKALVYFDDPQAEAAAEKYIPPDLLKEYRAARAAGQSPYGIKPPKQRNGGDQK